MNRSKTIIRVFIHQRSNEQDGHSEKEPANSFHSLKTKTGENYISGSMIGKIIELIHCHRSKRSKEFQKLQPLQKTKRGNSENVLKTKHCYQATT